MSDQLHGTVERVTYYSEETGYSVIRLNVPGQTGLLTVVGNLPEVQPGESLRLEGTWTTHPQYGRQFKAERCKQVLPATAEGVKRYLGSGLIKGVGPVTAARIVQRFGADTLRVLDEEPRRLREALGVGPKRAAAIARAWEEQKHIREVMLFLQSHGVTTGLAVKIYKTYGDDALRVVQEDPYRLARDIWGVGFKTADKIARDLGLPPDAPSRIQAGVAHALSQLADEGHVYAPEPELVSEAIKLLEVPPELAREAIKDLDADEVVRRETLVYSTADKRKGVPLRSPQVREEQAVYLAPFYYGEIGVTRRLQALVESPATRLAPFRSVDWDATAGSSRPGFRHRTLAAATGGRARCTHQQGDGAHRRPRNWQNRIRAHSHRCAGSVPLPVRPLRPHRPRRQASLGGHGPPGQDRPPVAGVLPAGGLSPQRGEPTGSGLPHRG